MRSLYILAWCFNSGGSFSPGARAGRGGNFFSSVGLSGARVASICLLRVTMIGLLAEWADGVDATSLERGGMNIESLRDSTGTGDLWIPSDSGRAGIGGGTG